MMGQHDGATMMRDRPSQRAEQEGVVTADVMALAAALNDALPQTQCTRCGFPDCHAYAWAIASGDAAINRCPPGGQEGIQRLAALSAQPALPLNPDNGTEAPRHLAVIDEAWCIGCTLCLKVCPVDCIVGGSKLMHTVSAAHCTGCELCLPACPVDCISLQPITQSRTGWDAWSAAQAQQARERYDEHRRRACAAELIAGSPPSPPSSEAAGPFREAEAEAVKVESHAASAREPRVAYSRAASGAVAPAGAPALAEVDAAAAKKRVVGAALVRARDARRS